jgi:hypothetical protein
MASTSPGYFYHSLIKKAIQIFGSRFNDIQIKRMNTDDTVEQTLSVPIQYGPIQKYLARIQGDRDNKRNVNAIFPRMAFEITGFQRDALRKINPTEKLNYGVNSGYVPVPYDIQFQLNVVSINAEDGLKIVEQIIPYFNPQLGLSAKLMDGYDKVFNIPLVLDSVNMTDTYEGDFMSRRAIIWQLDFTLKYYFIGPVTESKLIKFVKVNTYSTPEMDEIDEFYTAQPGLTANGQPTTDINETVAYTLINEDDDYGFIFQRNPE